MKAKKIALVLSGCGQHDGSETHETILTLLALHQHGMEWEAFSPNINQGQVIDHTNNKIDGSGTRNALIEAARLVRGKIKEFGKFNPSDFNGVIVPGGVGVLTTLSNYKEKGIHFVLEPGFKNFMMQAIQRRLPAGFICIAPLLIPKLYHDKPVLTIGEDVNFAKEIEQMGGIHEICPATEIVFDEKNKIVSTPANMVATNIGEVFDGIQKMVKKMGCL